MVSLIGRIIALLILSCIAANAATVGLKKTTDAAKSPHRIMIQVDQNDPAIMNLALNNATNVLEYYRTRGQVADVDIVAFGPGLNMLRTDTSPVGDRIKQMKDLAFPGTIRFSACNVTRQGMEKKEGKAIALLPEAAVVPSGVVHMIELQEKGWSYVRP